MSSRFLLCGLFAFFVSSLYGFGIKPGLRVGYMRMSITPQKYTVNDGKTEEIPDSLQKAAKGTGFMGELSLDMDLIAGLGVGLGLGYATTSAEEYTVPILNEDIDEGTATSIRLSAIGKFSPPMIPIISPYFAVGPIISLDKISGSADSVSVTGEIVTNFGIEAQIGIDITAMPILSIGGGLLFDYMLQSGSKMTTEDSEYTIEIEQSHWNLGIFVRATF